MTLTLTYPAPLPVGHLIEVTEYADPRPERKRRGFDRNEAFRHPSLLDLDTGIRYFNHVHASTGGNGGNVYTPNRYPFLPRTDLAVERVYRGRVAACSLIFVEGLVTQHTMLALDVDD